MLYCLFASYFLYTFLYCPFGELATSGLIFLFTDHLPFLLDIGFGKCCYLNSYKIVTSALHKYIYHCLKNWTGLDGRTVSTVTCRPFRFRQAPKIVLRVESIKIDGNRSKIDQNKSKSIKIEN